MPDISKPLNFIKKYRITILAVLAFTVALCCIFAFAGNNNEDLSVSSEAPEASSEAVEEVVTLQGEGIYIDGNFVAAVTSSEEANLIFDELLSTRVSAMDISDTAENSFNNNIEFVSGEYAEEAFTDADGLKKLLGMNNDFAVSGKISDYSGKTIPVKLSVRSVYTYSETVVIEHETKTIYTDAMRDGAIKVLTNGFDGEGEETYRITMIDGSDYEKEFVSLQVTVAPTEEVVRVGTCSEGILISSNSKFIKPYDGIVTSYMGPRWGRVHTGIDIAGFECDGKPVYASSEGVVVRSDYFGGYGNCVIIDHGDGVETLYSHLSAFSVSVGDTVAAGDEIGKIGATGNVTGPHLHFEVRVDGETVNPLLFVNYE